MDNEMLYLDAYVGNYLSSYPFDPYCIKYVSLDSSCTRHSTNSTYFVITGDWAALLLLSVSFSVHWAALFLLSVSFSVHWAALLLLSVSFSVHCAALLLLSVSFNVHARTYIVE